MNQSALDRIVVRISRTLTVAGVALAALVLSTGAWAAQLGTVTITAQAPSPVSPGSNATYTVTINRGAGGGVFDTTMLITNILPAGTVASFNPTNLHFSSSQDSKTSALTIQASFCAI